MATRFPSLIKGVAWSNFLSFSDEHSTLVLMVWNLATNYVSPQFHVVYDNKFLTIHNNTRLQDATIKAIFKNLVETCRNFYGEEGRPPELPVTASEGATVEDPPPELGGEWLTEAE